MVSAVSRFFDPLGILSPVIICFKVFLQELTKSEIEWDQPLTESLLGRWKALVYSLRDGLSITVPRVYFCDERQPDFYHLCGFCDASVSAYAAVIYLVITFGDERLVRLVASKTRVAPKVVQTIPRLELIGALLLSRLINTVTLRRSIFNSLYVIRTARLHSTGYMDKNVTGSHSFRIELKK